MEWMVDETWAEVVTVWIVVSATTGWAGAASPVFRISTNTEVFEVSNMCFPQATVGFGRLAHGNYAVPFFIVG